MEANEEQSRLRNFIVQPPSYAEAIQAPVLLPLPPYQTSEPRNSSPPPPYSEVVSQIIQETSNNSCTTDSDRGSHHTHVSCGSSRRDRRSSSRRSRVRRCRASWRRVELQIPRAPTDVTENLLQQVRRPPGSLPNLRLLRPPLQDPRPLRSGFPSVHNKKLIHIIAGGLGLLIPLGVIIAMATKEIQPEIETSTQLTTPPHDDGFWHMDMHSDSDVKIVPDIVFLPKKGRSL